MTVLTAIRAAILRTTGVVVQQAFASSDQIAVEMTDLANEVATDIARSHDWRGITKIAQITGTGAIEYDLPSDYHRMVLASEIDDAASWFWGYEPFQSVNDFMRFKSGTYSVISPGGWIILGGQLQFYPAPNGVAQFPYVSTQWARSSGGVAKSAFTADDDEFVLDERLLTLGLIWRWMSQKNLDYTEHLATYEMALAQTQARDKGAYVLRTPVRRFGGLGTAYSGRPIG
ncbi:MAG: hypothetical protein U5N55_12680 [Cypionkella sp.]|nr:hypothetical protein [Cypionkella sp.]